LAWVDAAKGSCILLVLAFHAGVMLEGRGRSVDGLYTLQETLGYALMPLFFFCSGLWAARGPWPALIGKRLAPLLYVFLLWTTLRWILHPWVSDLLGSRSEPLWTHVLQALIFPPGELWFLWALAVFTMLLKAAERLPTGLVTAVAAIPAFLVLSRAITLPSLAHYHAVENFVVFYLAAQLRPRVLAHVAGARLGGTFALGAGFFILAGLALVSTGFVKGALGSAATAVGVLAGLRLARPLAGAPLLGPVLALLGRLSLPVYLTHVILLALLMNLTGELSGLAGTLAAILLTVPAAAGGVLFGLLAPHLGLGVLFAPPFITLTPAPAVAR
jgi:uncharacterized membrane protein YcfT